MKVTFEIPSPEQITIGQFVEFYKAKSDINKCIAATGMSRDEVNLLPLVAVKQAVAAFMEVTQLIEEVEFPKIIELNGTQFGFEPNLNRIQTAAWADIAHLEDLGRDEHMHEILAILYRPVTFRFGSTNIKYRIEDYHANKGDSIDNADLFLDYKVCHARNVLGFFLLLQQGCMNALATLQTRELKKSVKEMKKIITTN